MSRINGLFHLLLNGVYWGFNPITNHLHPLPGKSKHGEPHPLYFSKKSSGWFCHTLVHTQHLPCFLVFKPPEFSEPNSWNQPRTQMTPVLIRISALFWRVDLQIFGVSWVLGILRFCGCVVNIFLPPYFHDCFGFQSFFGRHE